MLAVQFLLTGLLAELVVARKMTDMEPFSVAETKTPGPGPDPRAVRASCQASDRPARMAD